MTIRIQLVPSRAPDLGLRVVGAIGEENHDEWNLGSKDRDVNRCVHELREL